MADDASQFEHGLRSGLGRDPQHYSFWQAVRLLRQAESPGEFSLSVNPIRENVLFVGNPSMAFAKGDIEFITYQPNSVLPEWHVAVNFLSLYGATSPLPDHYSEEILFEGNDAPTRHFMDLFNHRLVCLYYEAWLKYRYFIQYQYGAVDVFSKRIFSLGGLAGKQQEPNALDWQNLLNFIGLFTLAHPSAGALSRLLEGYFNLNDVYVEEWVSSYIEIDPAQQVRLGRTNCSLGEEFSLGRRVRDIAGKFRVQLRNLSITQFREFSRGGGMHQTLRQLITLLLSAPLQFEISLELGFEAVPPMTLAMEQNHALGRDTWLGQPGLGDRNIAV